MKKANRKKSIFHKILVPTLLVVLIQFGLIYSVFFFGQTTRNMKENSLDFFEQKVSTRGGMLQSDMVGRWSNLDEYASIIENEILSYLSITQKTISDLKFQSETSEQVLSNVSNEVISIMRQNAVTGGFFILIGDNQEKKDGLYICDSNPESNPIGNSDLLVLNAPVKTSKEMEIAMDPSWKSFISFSNIDGQEKEFYHSPISMAQKGLLAANGKDISHRDLGYWSTDAIINSSANRNEPVVTYSVPIRASDGTPYAVLGIELKPDYLAAKMNAYEIGFGNQSGYMLAVKDNSEQEGKSKSGEYKVAAVSGEYMKSKLLIGSEIKLEALKNYEDTYLINNAAFENVMYASLCEIPLYNTNTPYESEQWVLIGGVAKSALFATHSDFIKLLVELLMIAIPSCLVVVYITAKAVSSPMLRLSKKLKSSDVHSEVVIDRINIVEVDEMLDSIEFFSRRAADSAYRLSKILDMAGVKIGAFEYDYRDRVSCTTGLLQMLEIRDAELEDRSENAVKTSVFEEVLHNLYQNVDERYSEFDAVEGTSDVCRFCGKSGDKWLRVRKIVNKTGMLGVVIDVTQDVIERKRIEHDRDYDMLTNIYNRRAFKDCMEELMQNPQKLKISAMVMLDIDNLKYINDTYGHDYGDDYIRKTASVFVNYFGEGFLCARQSGDEFNVFIYGYDSKDDIRSILNSIQNSMKQSAVKMPDGASINIRASAGIAWYPHDADNSDDLLRYADFAMYLVKKKHKGDFTEFDLDSYNKNSYLLSCREELNTIVEQSLVDYHFQPIVSAKTGEVFAYEALMRPTSQTVKTPDELLTLAHLHSKLAQIEKMTMFRSMEFFANLPEVQRSKKLFINSIASQILSADDILKFKQKNEKYLCQLVIEITESEDMEKELTDSKKSAVKSMGAYIALDDYGSGYNGETVLLELMPDYIKIDLYFVRNIHLNKDRLEMVRNFITFAHDRKISVIAEGVECKEEMETLIVEGVDYMQGFYFEKPSALPSDEMPAAIKESILQLNTKKAALKFGG